MRGERVNISHDATFKTTTVGGRPFPVCPQVIPRLFPGHIPVIPPLVRVSFYFGRMGIPTYSYACRV